jgi:beta-lactam-binding protein with PASTA domain
MTLVFWGMRSFIAASLLAPALGLGCSAWAPDIHSSATSAKVTVPGVVGRLQAGAARRLRAARLRPHAVQVRSLALVGTVVAQRPAAGKRVAAGTRVTISVSGGPGP